MAPAVMAKLLEYFEDDTSPHHQWAIEFLAQRIVPRKLYEELGGQAAGVGSLQDKRPQFILNVITANPGKARWASLRARSAGALQRQTNQPQGSSARPERRAHTADVAGSSPPLQPIP
jgi:hypothetical protein